MVSWDWIGLDRIGLGEMRAPNSQAIGELVHGSGPQDLAQDYSLPKLCSHHFNF